MSTINQVSASRANGARSLGPVTPEGKKRSSRNAVRHGLLARCVVLDNESRECFDRHHAQFLDCFRPANDVELGMIEEMIAASWRQRRALAIETRLLDLAIAKEPGDDELIRLAAAYTSLSQQPQSDLISRYETRLQRMFQRSLNNLLLLRSIELPNEPGNRPVDPPDTVSVRIDLPNEPGPGIELPNEPGVHSLALPIDSGLRVERPNEPDICSIDPNALGVHAIELRNEPAILTIALPNDAGTRSLASPNEPGTRVELLNDPSIRITLPNEPADPSLIFS
jgi:hypothetical protein